MLAPSPNRTGREEGMGGGRGEGGAWRAHSGGEPWKPNGLSIAAALTPSVQRARRNGPASDTPRAARSGPQRKHARARATRGAVHRQCSGVGSLHRPPPPPPPVGGHGVGGA